MAPHDPSRLHFIDALRGLAALYVVFFHMVVIGHLPEPALLAPLITNGGTGVTLFFVVSAFTLCLTLHGRTGESGWVRRFYTRRVFRIVPLYVLWLVVMVMYRWQGHWYGHARELLLYGAFGFNFFPRFQEGLVYASWTLGVEMVFYFFFPLIFLVVNTLPRAVAFVLATLALATGYDRVIAILGAHIDRRDQFIHFSVLHQLPVFAIGIVSFFVYTAAQHWPAPRRQARVALAVGAAIFLATPYWLPSVGGAVPLIYVMAIAYSLLLFGLAFIPLPAVVNRASVFFGAISYSLYLNHPLLVNELGGAYRGLSSHGWPDLVTLAAALALTLAILTSASWVTYRLVEQPWISLGGRAIGWRKRRHVAANTSAEPSPSPA
jgi:peptidoglycan/LPS O-acetylase OafA/YrhL